MSADGPLSPLKALALAARMLEANGFTVVARNERGDSLYLKRPDGPWHLRVSNHPRTAKQRSRRTDILASLIIDGPRSPERLRIHDAEAVRNFQGALARKGDQASADGSRK